MLIAKEQNVLTRNGVTKLFASKLDELVLVGNSSTGLTIGHNEMNLFFVELENEKFVYAITSTNELMRTREETFFLEPRLKAERI